MLRKLTPALFILLYHMAQASQKVAVAPAPSWLYKINADLAKKPEAKAISNGYYLELMESQVNLSSQTEYTHFIRHIINESGVENGSEVSVSFSPEYESVSFHKITVWREGKQVSQLSPDQIKVVQEESNASDLEYNGIKRAYVVLKDVRKEDRIEVSYSVTGFNPVFANHYSEDFYFAQSTAICNYYITIIAPKERKINFTYFNNAKAPETIAQGNNTIYTWSNPPMKLWDSEESTPDWYINCPYISLSEYNNWKEVIDWGVLTFKDYAYTLPAGLKDKIDQWHKEAKGEKDDFTVLALRFVQDQVRYLGLEIGENSHRPHPPEEVFKNRFGDCKDKALLLTTILRQEGIKAYVALVNTSKRDRLLEAAPSPGEFNHAIVAIERSDNNYIYVDPTYTHQQGDLVNNYVPAYGQALILRKGYERLMPVEKGGETSYNITETYWVKNNADGNTSLEVESHYEGGMADQVRSSLANNSLHDLEESYLKYYTNTFDNIRQEKDWVIKDDSATNAINVSKTYTIRKIWKEEKGKEKFSVNCRRIYEQLPDPTDMVHETPIALDFPLNLTSTIVINFPDDWALDAEPIRVRNDSYEFDFEPKLIGSRVKLYYHLKTLKDHIPLKDLEQYKDDYRKISEYFQFEFTNGKHVYKNNHVDTKNQVSGSIMLVALFFAVGLFMVIRYFINM